METFKTTLNINTENLMKDVERFSAKWDQVKPRPSSGQIMSESFKDLQQHLQDIKGKREQWQEVLEQKRKLMLAKVTRQFSVLNCTFKFQK